MKYQIRYVASNGEFDRSTFLVTMRSVVKSPNSLKKDTMLTASAPVMMRIVALKLPVCFRDISAMVAKIKTSTESTTMIVAVVLISLGTHNAISVPSWVLIIPLGHGTQYPVVSLLYVVSLHVHSPLSGERINVSTQLHSVDPGRDSSFNFLLHLPSHREDARPVELPYVFSGHFVAFHDPGGQKYPLGHCTHVVWLESE